MFKIWSAKGNDAVKYGKFVVAKYNSTNSTTESSAKTSAQKEIDRIDKTEKLSKDAFLKKYFNGKEFNQKKELEKLLGRYYINRSAGKDGTIQKRVIYIGVDYVFGASFHKAQMGRYNTHISFVVPYEVLDNTFVAYEQDKDCRGGKIKKAAELVRTINFKKDNTLYSHEADTNLARQYKIIATSHKDFQKLKKYQWHTDMHKWRTESGDRQLCSDLTLHNMVSWLYINTHKKVSGMKENKLLKINKAGFSTYSKRGKSLGEEVLNYTTSGELGGKKDNYWFALKNDKCSFQPVGLAYWDVIWTRKKTPLNIRKINQTGFKVEPKTIQRLNNGRVRTQFHLTSGNKTYFHASGSLDILRLDKAWKFLFQECPGKKSRF